MIKHYFSVCAVTLINKGSTGKGDNKKDSLVLDSLHAKRGHLKDCGAWLIVARQLVNCADVGDFSTQVPCIMIVYIYCICI